MPKRLKLYDYQLDAIDRMKKGCILNGGVGSGKSFTSIGYYYIFNKGSKDFLKGSGVHKRMVKPKDLYIITTAMKRDKEEWLGELSPFYLSPDNKKNLYSNKVVIDSWNNIEKYKSIRNAFFIFDEDRVTGKGKWVQSFLKIAKANHWLILSATPGDTWEQYIPVFIANGFYKNRSEFTREHIIYKHFRNFPQIDRYVGTKKLERLRDNILVDMDFNRPTKAYHRDIYTDYNKDRYKQIMKDRWNIWDDVPIENASQLCYMLRKVVNEDEHRLFETVKIVKSRKKVIIFYNFDYELEALRTLNQYTNVKIAEWNGHKHEPVPSTKRWVYLVQYAAGAEGWSCITTDSMIFYSQNYSYKVMLQATGRIDRLNTPYKDLYYYHLKSKSNIDLSISKALKDKKNFNESRWLEKW